MTNLRWDHGMSRLDRLDAAVIDLQLREALRDRAERLGLDPASIDSPTSGTLVARTVDGALLRVDFRTYQARELER
jgi:hypothetical protein